MAAITIDAKVAEQAALLAMMLEPPYQDETALLRDLTEGEIADLGEGLVHFARPLLHEIETGETGEAGGQEVVGSEPPWWGPGGGEALGPFDPVVQPTWMEPGIGGPWNVGLPVEPGPVMGGPGAEGGQAAARGTSGVLGRIMGRGATPWIDREARRLGWVRVEVVPQPGAVSIKPSVDEILHKGTADMLGTAGAALPLAHHVQQLLGTHDLAINAPALLGEALAGSRKLWDNLRRVAARAWQDLLTKLSRWTTQIDQVGGWFAEQGQRVVDWLGTHGVNWLLWRMLNGREVVALGDEALIGTPDALGECDPVVKHHAKQRRYVPLLNKALPVLITWNAPAGASAAAILLIFSIWTAHDHIDSPLLQGVRIPGNPGLLTALGTSWPS